MGTDKNYTVALTLTSWKTQAISNVNVTRLSEESHYASPVFIIMRTENVNSPQIHAIDLPKGKQKSSEDIYSHNRSECKGDSTVDIALSSRELRFGILIPKG